MTTAELFSRLLSKASVRDPGRVPFDDAVEIVAGMNAGISEFYALAPARFSKKTISVLLPAPSALSVLATKESQTLGGNPFSAAQRGATVVIGDHADQNEVLGPNTLLDAYLGTSGTVNATVYGDAVVILDSTYKRIVSNPRLNNGSELKEVPPIADRNTFYNRFPVTRGIGTPHWYYVEMTGASAGGKDVAILRVDPMPNKAYILRMEAEVNPLKVAYADLTAPVDVPVPAHMEDVLISLIRWHLKGNELFPEKPNTDEKAALARQTVQNQAPDAGRSHGRVFTPRGW